MAHVIGTGGHFLGGLCRAFAFTTVGTRVRKLADDQPGHQQ